MDIIIGHYSEITWLCILFELSKYIAPQYKFFFLPLSLFFFFGKSHYRSNLRKVIKMKKKKILSL